MSRTFRRPGLLLGLPSWLLLLLTVLPLVVGARTLYYRDVLNTHYALKASQAQLEDDGLFGSLPFVSLPVVDPHRGGGQPLLGNPNAVPLYPDNLLYRVAHPLWALNAHFWLHWLLAPFAGYWFGRAWRLGQAGAWACGVAWATGGYVLSLLNLYNMVATAALAPALVAAFLALARSARWCWRAQVPRLAAAAVLTGLTLLGGDPSSAAVACLLAATAFLAVAHGPAGVRTLSRAALPRAAIAAGLGLMLAAPLLVEMLRVLPSSYRGLWRYEAHTVLAQSWHPATLLDWWLPGFFGRLDLSFWGQEFFGGNPPFLSSLFPGWIVVALVVAAGLRRRKLQVWAWGAILGGLFVALGAHNSLLDRAAEWSVFNLLRYPVKAWLAVAMGLSLLAGLGFERLWRGARHGVFAGALLAFAGASVVAQPLLDADSALARLVSKATAGRLGASFLEAEVARWAGIWIAGLLTLAAALLILALSRRRPGTLALLLVLHTVSQLHLLAPLLHTDDAGPYLAESPVVQYLPAAADVVHGGFDDQFGAAGFDPRNVSDPSLVWWIRALFAELSHGAGVVHGLRYPFTRSPEGLDSFYAVVFAKALPRLDDVGRLRLLEAAGVDVLLLKRPLDPVAAARVSSPVLPSLGSDIHFYRLLHGADEISLVTSVRRARSMTEARDALLDGSFDPRVAVVLPAREATPNGSLGTSLSAGARADLVAVSLRQAERLAATTDTDSAAVLVVQRAWLPIWRATIDGETVDIEIANGWQMAVAVPAGRHEVELFVDRRPTRWATAVMLLAMTLLVGLLVPFRPIKPGACRSGRLAVIRPRAGRASGAAD